MQSSSRTTTARLAWAVRHSVTSPFAAQTCSSAITCSARLSCSVRTHVLSRLSSWSRPDRFARNLSLSSCHAARFTSSDSSSRAQRHRRDGSRPHDLFIASGRSAAQQRCSLGTRRHQRQRRKDCSAYGDDAEQERVYCCGASASDVAIVFDGRRAEPANTPMVEQARSKDGEIQ
jgi:hypothetical protein